MQSEEKIVVPLTKKQRKIVKSLVGVVGRSEGEVLQNIFVIWLTNQPVFSEFLKEKVLGGGDDEK